MQGRRHFLCPAPPRRPRYVVVPCHQPCRSPTRFWLQEGGPLGSSISCFYLFDAYAEAHCSGANLALDLAKFAVRGQGLGQGQGPACPPPGAPAPAPSSVVPRSGHHRRFPSPSLPLRLLQEEEEALPKGVTNRDENTLFIEHPRPGLAGELRGDCKLHGSKWEVRAWRRRRQESHTHTVGPAGRRPTDSCLCWGMRGSLLPTCFYCSPSAGTHRCGGTPPPPAGFPLQQGRPDVALPRLPVHARGCARPLPCTAPQSAPLWCRACTACASPADPSILSRAVPPLADAASKQPRCVAWVEHPVYFLNDKYDSVNLWHALEDVTHAFEAYAMKGWPAREPQVGDGSAGRGRGQVMSSGTWFGPGRGGACWRRRLRGGAACLGMVGLGPSFRPVTHPPCDALWPTPHVLCRWWCWTRSAWSRCWGPHTCPCGKRCVAALPESLF